MICGANPRVLIGDATAESIQKRHYHGDPITTSSDDVPPIARPSTKAERSALGITRTHQLVAQFAEFARTYGDVPASNDSTRVPFNPVQDRQDLFYAGFLADAHILFEKVMDHLQQQILPPDVRRKLARFIAALASESPVVSYLPLSVVMLLAEVLQSENPAERILASATLYEIRRDAPLVADFLQAAQHLEGKDHVHLPDMALRVLSRLVRKTETCCSGPPIHPVIAQPAQAPSMQPQPQTASCATNECLRSGICSGVPRVRVRPVYGMENEGSGGIDTSDSSAHASCASSSSCRHAFTPGSRGSHRTGGIFTWFCEHGVCYGFYMIPDAEGRNEAFSFITTHFQSAPDVIVYDFACALQDYCLNREPYFFRNSKFLVDRFHWFNHAACARSYNLSLYEQYAHVNSQVAEQWNSALKRIKATVGQMCQEAFMFNVRLFLDVRNAERNEALRIMLANSSRL